jgi:hypothetical protein
MYCPVNVIQFASSVSPLKWVDAASLPAEPCTLHFHCYWQQPSSCIHSIHLVDAFIRHVLKKQPAELQTLVHAQWNVAKTDRWLQLSQVTTLYQMHDTLHEDNSSRKLYLKPPLALHPISNRATDTPVTYQLHSSLPVTCLRYWWSMCVRDVHRAMHTATEMYLLHTVPVHSKPCIHQ